MKILVALLLVFPAAAVAQTTDFTLGAPHNNYAPVLYQDGHATSGLWYVDYVYDCALTTVVCPGYPQGSVAIEMPNDPANPGQRFYASCTGVLVSDNRPARGTATQQPSGNLVSQETCTGNGNSTWSGTLTYSYASVKQTHCSGGRGGHCVTAYYPVMTGGYGDLTRR
jgi:prepilin-type processing-associated H-X9-DG protein